MRTTVWMLLVILLIATAVYGLEFSRESSARHRGTPEVGILPGEVQHDGREDYDGLGPSHYAR